MPGPVPVDPGLVPLDPVPCLELRHCLPDVGAEASVDGTAVGNVRQLEQSRLQFIHTMAGVALAQYAGSRNLRKRGIAGGRLARSAGLRGRDRRGDIRRVIRRDIRR